MSKRPFRIFKRSALVFILFGMSSHNVPAASFETPYNQAILNILKEMPEGGGYSVKSPAMEHLKSSMLMDNGHLSVDAEKATPSFCSSATYLVFLKLVMELQKDKKIDLSVAALQGLLVKGEPDGSGVWGRWNANGPGTARFFYELNLGRNFTKISEAQPGDFMKIFWTTEIGAKERGHSVIFTGTRPAFWGRRICFWSSNLASSGRPAGMGEICVAESKIRRVVFSRLEFPENLQDVADKMSAGSATYTDIYLRDLLKKPSSPEEMCKKVGCQ